MMKVLGIVKEVIVTIILALGLFLLVDNTMDYAANEGAKNMKEETSYTYVEVEKESFGVYTITCGYNILGLDVGVQERKFDVIEEIKCGIEELME